jgi:tRNA(Ser,Leu) C12 N-acetylase TAN1
MLPPNLPPDSTLLVSGEKAAAHADTMHDTIYKTIEKICKSETCEKRMHTVIAEQRGAGDPFNSEKNAQEIIDRVLKAEGHIW